MIPELQNPNTSVFHEPSISGAHYFVSPIKRTIEQSKIFNWPLTIEHSTEQIQQHWPATSGRMFGAHGSRHNGPSNQ